MASCPSTSWQIDGEIVKTVTDFILGGSKITAAMKLKDVCSLEEKLWPTKTAYSKAETLLCQQSPSCHNYGLSSSHVWMWELDYKESWASKNWCFWTVVLEKTLESPLDSKEISSVQFSWAIMSDSLQPCGMCHIRLLCPSPTPGAYSN